MAKLKGGPIQMALEGDGESSPESIRQAMIEADLPPIGQAGRQGVQVLCCRQVCTQPFFRPSRSEKWYAAAAAKGVFTGAVNRVGRIEAIASRDRDALPAREMHFDKIREIRNKWQFFRDRRPETYGPLTDLGH